MLKKEWLKYNSLVLGLSLLLLPSIFVIGFSNEKPIEEISGKVKSFDGYTVMLETENGEVIHSKLHNIHIADTENSWKVFHVILDNALVLVEIYGKDREGNYLVEIDVDGYDFDKYVVENNFAFYIK